MRPGDFPLGFLLKIKSEALMLGCIMLTALWVAKGLALFSFGLGFRHCFLGYLGFMYDFFLFFTGFRRFFHFTFHNLHYVKNLFNFPLEKQA
jgi:hypothetical protein